MKNLLLFTTFFATFYNINCLTCKDGSKALEKYKKLPGENVSYRYYDCINDKCNSYSDCAYKFLYDRCCLGNCVYQRSIEPWVFVGCPR